jgi:SAM-dependent methyltransferase
MTVDPAVRAQWASVAERYGRGWARAAGPDLGWLVEALAPDPADRALDIGSGAGHAALAVAPRVAEVVAADPTPEMLAVAAGLAAERGIANLRFVEASAASLPFDDGSFDLAFSRHSIHHWPDAAAGFREIRRVLRSGGRFVAVDLHAPDEEPVAAFLVALELLRDPTHVRALAPADWIRLLEGAGFRAAIVRTWEIRHETETWLVNTNPAPWRAEAVRALLREAPAAVRERLQVAADGSSFRVEAGLVLGEVQR